ncbi:hypothetical protein LCGC14_2251710, partial [marine sediment metagenome]
MLHKKGGEVMYKLQWLPEYNLWGLRYFPPEHTKG